ncbi:MAG: GTP-sensing pleiotropic transcriptional regulator CodY [Syntrophomonadaceae bacterium]|nr:GTP-sensing pleiotropic transcriptional regulator CodY [Syntrophomonadaceae bacterium]
MGKSLLEKSRALNKMMRQIPVHEKKPDYDGAAQMMTDNLECNVYILGRRGKLLGWAFVPGEECDDIESVVSFTERFPSSFDQNLLQAEETEVNIPIPSGQCVFNAENGCCSEKERLAAIVPIFGGAGRMGSFLLVKSVGQFEEEDIILAEYGATVVANEMMRIRSERVEEEARNKASVQVAVATLSYSEREAIDHIMAELEGNEGFVVASRIADKVGITRSVIVSALRKFESAGVIESRSLGMKGTYIKVLNENLFEELEKR